jgi:hypothetical protein
MKDSQKFWDKFKIPQDVYIDGSCLHESDKSTYDELVSLEAKIELMEFVNKHSKKPIFKGLLDTAKGELQQLKDKHKL